jgi:phage-related protein
MVRKEVVFYYKESGGSPVQDFLDELPSKVAQKVVWTLALAEDLDRVPAQYFCKLTDSDDIWEFRIKLGSNIYRILAFLDQHKIVLTHGFIKKTQKTPVQEIVRAENLRKEYFQRKKQNE